MLFVNRETYHELIVKKRNFFLVESYSEIRGEQDE